MKKTNIIIFIITGISFFVLIFFLNMYEVKNNCIINAIPNLPFISCIKYSDDNFKLNNPRFDRVDKPLILLYPQKDTLVDIQLNFQPWFSATFPEYNTNKKWWSVLAHPDGTLIDYSSNQETYGLFWEGLASDMEFDLTKGFVMKGSEVRDFLYAKLREMGLETKEYSDFIMYWYPKLQDYPYVQITFAGKDYTNKAILDITPKPDSLLRVFMIAKPLSEYQNIQPQTFEKFERNGFSVVEWGGTVIQ